MKSKRRSKEKIQDLNERSKERAKERDRDYNGQYHFKNTSQIIQKDFIIYNDKTVLKPQKRQTTTEQIADLKNNIGKKASYQ